MLWRWSPLFGSGVISEILDDWDLFFVCTNYELSLPPRIKNWSYNDVFFFLVVSAAPMARHTGVCEGVCEERVIIFLTRTGAF
jgi:hypothetical protein